MSDLLNSSKSSRCSLTQGFQRRIIRGIPAVLLLFTVSWSVANRSCWIEGQSLRARPVPLRAQNSRVVLAAVSPEVMWTQGERYLMSQDVSDAERADGLRMVQQAAEEGYGPAMNALGVFFCKGMFGIPQDYQAGEDWFERAWKAGYLEAYHNLGLFKLNSESGFPQNKRAAAHHFATAAKAGHSPSMYTLGLQLMKGDGIPCDRQMGFSWVQKFHEANPELVKDFERRRLAGQLSPEEQKMYQEKFEKTRKLLRDSPFRKRGERQVNYEDQDSSS
eukprot:TRINITY_DN109279_c0_g1_i1.p1 TRINITY_DN109279_c0_g1~~TRINITY_DN109279_c0_g1_i1.p1  ORF type:complete len:276 (-),score=44.50 TRINITY_DN109279_c0_g1_i1:8-835(-)